MIRSNLIGFLVSSSLPHFPLFSCPSSFYPPTCPRSPLLEECEIFELRASWVHWGTSVEVIRREISNESCQKGFVVSVL